MAQPGTAPTTDSDPCPQAETNVNHVNSLGWTALLEAVILGGGSTRYQDVVRILLDAGGPQPG